MSTNSSNQDECLPVANVMRIMRRALPVNMRISEGALQAVMDCVSEYINLLTGEANLHCHNDHRRTLTANDILLAMDRLGFDDYAQTLTLYLNRYRQAQQSNDNLALDELPSARRSHRPGYFPAEAVQPPRAALGRAPGNTGGFPMVRPMIMFDAFAVAMSGRVNEGCAGESGGEGSSSSGQADMTKLGFNAKRDSNGYHDGSNM